MKRGEVYWYTFKAPNKRRPVLILTRNTVMPYLNTVTVAPITTRIRDIPSEILLTTEDGMYENCVVNFDNIQTVSQSKIGKIIIQLPPERLDEIRTAINFALGLDNDLW